MAKRTKPKARLVSSEGKYYRITNKAYGEKALKEITLFEEKGNALSKFSEDAIWKEMLRRWGIEQ